MSAFGGKADIGLCAAHVCFRGQIYIGTFCDAQCLLLTQSGHRRYSPIQNEEPLQNAGHLSASRGTLTSKAELGFEPHSALNTPGWRNGGRPCGIAVIMSAKSGNSLATVLVAAAIVAALYFGREVLLPMALAVLLSFVLAPLVKLLQRLYLPRFAAVTIVVLLAFGVICGLATLMFAQVS